MTPDDAGWAAAEEPAEAATLPDVAGGGAPEGPLVGAGRPTAAYAAAMACSSDLPSSFAVFYASVCLGVGLGNAALNAAEGVTIPSVKFSC